MGERATVEYNGVTIYTHWEGDRVKEHINVAWARTWGKEAFPSVLLNIMSGREDGTPRVFITRADCQCAVDIDIPSRMVFGKTFNEFIENPVEAPKDYFYIKLCKEDYIGLEYRVTCSPKEAGDRIAAALRHRSRWDDEHYLTRIIYDALCGHSFEETGFGISGGTCLHEDRHFSINPEARTISWSDYGGKGGKNEPIDEVLEEW